MDDRSCCKYRIYIHIAGYSTGILIPAAKRVGVLRIRFLRRGVTAGCCLSLVDRRGLENIAVSIVPGDCIGERDRGKYRIYIHIAGYSTGILIPAAERVSILRIRFLRRSITAGCCLSLVDRRSLENIAVSIVPGHRIGIDDLGCIEYRVHIHIAGDTGGVLIPVIKCICIIRIRFLRRILAAEISRFPFIDRRGLKDAAISIVPGHRVGAYDRGLVISRKYIRIAGYSIVDGVHTPSGKVIGIGFVCRFRRGFAVIGNGFPFIDCRSLKDIIISIVPGHRIGAYDRGLVISRKYIHIAGYSIVDGVHTPSGKVIGIGFVCRFRRGFAVIGNGFPFIDCRSLKDIIISIVPGHRIGAYDRGLVISRKYIHIAGYSIVDGVHTPSGKVICVVIVCRFRRGFAAIGNGFPFIDCRSLKDIVISIEPGHSIGIDHRRIGEFIIAAGIGHGFSGYYILLRLHHIVITAADHHFAVLQRSVASIIILQGDQILIRRGNKIAALQIQICAVGYIPDYLECGLRIVGAGNLSVFIIITVCDIECSALYNKQAAVARRVRTGAVLPRTVLTRIQQLDGISGQI